MPDNPAAKTSKANRASQTRSRTIDKTAQDQIGAKLRDMYDHVRHEPVPDRLLDLLKQLENGQGKANG